MRFRNLVIVGTSHIAKQSLEEVERVITKEEPAIIAVELDRRRLQSLFHEDKKGVPLKMILKIGIKGYLFSIIGGYAQKKLGKIVGVVPGSEMKKAVELAHKKKTKLALIDQDIEVTLRKFSARLSWKEKFRFLADIFRAVFFRKRELKKLGIESFDLSKVPGKELIKKLTIQLKKRYPNVHYVLVEERNRIMAANLHKLMELLSKEKEQGKEQEKIVAVVGAGHEEELLDIIRAKYS